MLSFLENRLIIGTRPDPYSSVKGCHLMCFLPFHDASLQSVTVNHSLKCYNNLTFLTKKMKVVKKTWKLYLISSRLPTTEKRGCSIKVMSDHSEFCASGSSTYVQTSSPVITVPCSFTAFGGNKSENFGKGNNLWINVRLKRLGTL